MALIARVYRSRPDERRGAQRYPAEVDATLRVVDDVPLDVLIYDLSMTGFRMETAEPLDPGTMIWVGIAGTRVNAAVVARRGPTGYGCEFVSPITFYQLSEALNPTETVIPFERGGPAEAGDGPGDRPDDRSGDRPRLRIPDRLRDAVARLPWRRALLALVALGAFVLCMVSLWPF
ncbi:MAG: PilZ domain-containing protein [Pseudomonadota bacterium]